MQGEQDSRGDLGSQVLLLGFPFPTVPVQSGSRPGTFLSAPVFQHLPKSSPSSHGWHRWPGSAPASRLPALPLPLPLVLLLVSLSLWVPWSLHWGPELRASLPLPAVHQCCSEPSRAGAEQGLGKQGGQQMLAMGPAWALLAQGGRRGQGQTPGCHSFQIKEPPVWKTLP